MPKAKFAFKRNARSQDSAKMESKEKETSTLPTFSPITNLTDDSISTTSYLSIRDKIDETLSLNDIVGIQIQGASDLHILDLQNCIVDLRNLESRSKFLALQLRNLHRCVILCGSINGSTMVHNCRDSIIAIECKQVSDSKGANFPRNFQYLSITAHNYCFVPVSYAFVCIDGHFHFYIICGHH